MELSLWVAPISVLWLLPEQRLMLPPSSQDYLSLYPLTLTLLGARYRVQLYTGGKGKLAKVIAWSKMLSWKFMLPYRMTPFR